MGVKPLAYPDPSDNPTGGSRELTAALAGGMAARSRGRSPSDFLGTDFHTGPSNAEA